MASNPSAGSTENVGPEATSVFATIVVIALGLIGGIAFTTRQLLLAITAAASLFGCLIIFASVTWNEKRKIVFSIFAGYILIGLAVGGALLALSTLQPSGQSGWRTTALVQEDFAIRVQIPSRIQTSPVDLSPFDFLLVASLGFTDASQPSFNGTARLSLTDIDPPVSLGPSARSALEFNNGTREGSIDLRFLPGTGVRGESFTIRFVADFNITTSTGNVFRGSLPGSITFDVKASDFVSGWYLLFIFSGILTSFFWRLGNDFFEKKGQVFPNEWNMQPPATGLKIAYLLALPLFSLLIALVVFRQFQQSLTVTGDPLVNGIAGFSYGFFWESATHKFGESLSITKKMGPAPQPPPGAVPSALSVTPPSGGGPPLP